MSILLCKVNFHVGIACTIKVYQNSRIICQHDVRDIKGWFVLGLVDELYSIDFSADSQINYISNFSY